MRTALAVSCPSGLMDCKDERWLFTAMLCRAHHVDCLSRTGCVVRPKSGNKDVLPKYLGMACLITILMSSIILRTAFMMQHSIASDFLPLQGRA